MTLMLLIQAEDSPVPKPEAAISLLMIGPSAVADAPLTPGSMKGSEPKYSMEFSASPRSVNASMLVVLVKVVKPVTVIFFRRSGTNLPLDMVARKPKDIMKLRMDSRLSFRCSRIQSWPRSLMFFPSIIVCIVEMVASFFSIGEPFVKIFVKPKGFAPARAACRSKALRCPAGRVSGSCNWLQKKPTKPKAARARYVTFSMPGFTRFSIMPSSSGPSMMAIPIMADALDARMPNS
mmetsp:Transcript_40068/g.108218  ORF Transcript_40068/g.108218 Transcript_40068/m.108218 type:complete len:235 (-) Transcript_40068:235-939(-)